MQGDKVIVYERGNLLFVFNFHPTNSYTDYRVGTDWGGEYTVVLSSDDKDFGGHERIDKSVHHFSTNMSWNNRANYLQVSSALSCVENTAHALTVALPAQQDSAGLGALTVALKKYICCLSVQFLVAVRAPRARTDASSTPPLTLSPASTVSPLV